MTWMSTPYMRSGVELDRLAIEGIRVNGYHGVLDSERETGQVFKADVVAHVSTRAAALNDDLARTVNYSTIADRAAEVLGGEPAELIETVAERIALAVLEMDGVYCVDVRVHKPQAPLHVEFKDVSVTIRRDLRTGGLWADKRIGSSAGMPDDPLAFDSQPPVFDQFDQRPVRPVPVLLAIGGNVGDVEQTLRQAVGELDRIPGNTVRGTSALVKSAPAGGPPQPDYLNAVVRLETEMSPRELLGACQGLEIAHDRERTEVNGPRTLDIDIIDFDGAVGETDDLTLPHPRAHERGFVVVPWAHMEPDAQLPGVGSVAQLARRLAASVALVADPWPAQSSHASA
ncbi:2-amino-4-hydroxy-6-hydroxymethyldihydropteridine diphosphokinase [Demequina sp. TTPB684]|uniref:2-amino-4-hydroxy-6- hydroxymethyldihydropteridine diphosphokinase n=1 Tax=unclassified Demequina TaxID=2620311 RepID=UPI001CF29330|nr:MULTISPECIES: 2-amino-4-hydroxy-6-hydroxymethyldihydropteridine diphosphokinase [unclassified Demequina]MCB2413352.1 2-amino-4-hydroxy-6-hydroxymethyldihydropteridine diphosphokinase [Demequina sp. TTPB684]UPU87490.1 2-amino-4-hydroxy-6-hydroxymethyldihydropteridine diphosphokinase [Demequina sp. TMPB413]